MIYAIVQLKLQDPEAMGAYREKAADALSKHGGQVVTASGELTAIDGAPNLPDFAVILSFPDKAAAEAWIGDPALAETHALRRKGAQSDIFLVG